MWSVWQEMPTITGDPEADLHISDRSPFIDGEHVGAGVRAEAPFERA